MKAEHRKELETNILADRMGRLVQRVKTKPQRRTVLYFVLVLVLLIAGLVYYRLRVGHTQQNAQHWWQLYVAPKPWVEEMAGVAVVNEGQRKGRTLVDNTEFGKAGKAARMQLARFFLWEQGVRDLGGVTGGTATRAMINIGNAEELYKTAIDEKPDDPLLLAEAYYGMAVIQETRALQDTAYLKKAVTAYKILLQDEFSKTGYAELAKNRLKILEDKKLNDELVNVCRELQRELRIPAPEVRANPAPAVPQQPMPPLPVEQP